MYIFGGQLLDLEHAQSFAVRVFTPETYKTNLSSPQLSEGVWKEMVGYKPRNLKRAYWSLLAGFVPLVIAVVYYLKFLDGPSQTFSQEN